MWRNKKWKHTDFPSNGVNPQGTCLVQFCLSWLRESSLEGGMTSRVSRSSQILASDYSPEITCTSWPIWDRGLAHCSSPEPLSLGNKPHESFGCIYHDCSQLNPFGNSNDFSCHCCLHKAEAITSSISALSPEILEALITVQWKRTMLNSF